ncbi:hypothetical protein BGZ63DRAFT_412466 [Mariannaea sp. PMI_226]|nr:hypothetical protein BGZ63DRAFT_412466 [Mariannaea sp. PMI_226]
MSLARRDNGCYECFKRRIKCDKTEPECFKCLKKGISCSGQGLRCRLSSHMAGEKSPARVPGKQGESSKSIRKVEPPSSPTPFMSSRARTTRRSYRWVDVSNSPHTEGSSTPPRQSTPNSLSEPALSPSPPIQNQDHANSETSENMALIRRESFTVQPSLNEPIHPQARMLFQHFAQSVAPVMVVFDSESNGYRDIILPLACQDMVLARAVSVAATFHLAQKAPELRQTAEAGHHAIIEKLRSDSLSRPGEVFNQYTLATLLVLLVGETITGADNYGYLLEMLECFRQALGSIVLPPGLQKFFQQQIKMFQLFGLPLSNEQKGLQVLSSPDYYFEFMEYPHLAPGSTYYTNLALIRAAIMDACGLYRRRVEASLSQDDSTHLVEQLRQKVAKIGLDGPGVHALVWTCFIAGAESIIPEHRKFFSDRLKLLYTYTGFGSIPAALKSLETLWAMKTPRRWTDIITTDIPVLIM